MPQKLEEEESKIPPTHGMSLSNARSPSTQEEDKNILFTSLQWKLNKEWDLSLKVILCLWIDG